MRAFKFTSADDSASAIDRLVKNPNAQFLGGGTNLLDLMKEGVAQPDEVVDINRIELNKIKRLASGGIELGALGTNTDAANDPIVRSNFPLLTKAILAGASAQIRNMATNGGNLLQRTRCTYFYDVAMPCNKRTPGTGCSAMQGFNRMHALFGWSKDCVAVYPSDMAVALAALNATVMVTQPGGNERTIAVRDFHRLPGNHPAKDNNLSHGDLIRSIEIPFNRFAANSAYVKVRDRNSYAFALVSVAAGLELDGDTIAAAHISMGGVAHKPWQAINAENHLRGKPATPENFRLAAEAEMSQARPLTHNQFKVQMGKNTIINALEQALKGSGTKL